ncbi:MAG: lactate racemase domain-containing protein [Chloroflexota bacterium]
MQAAADPFLSESGDLVLRTAAWYGDRQIRLPVRPAWSIEVNGPRIGVALPLSDDDIATRLTAPTGTKTLRELAEGKKHPLIVVDDLNRPTPTARVIPTILAELAEAGIEASSVGIMLAPGTHGAPPPDGPAKKAGDIGARNCRLYVHDCRGETVNAGSTSFGTPILVNPLVMKSDLLIGLGGVYPNQTAGFGGGTKLALGVLGFRSIAHLHLSHTPSAWGHPDQASALRTDLDEISQRIGLRFVISLGLNANRDVVRVDCGDPQRYYPEAVQWAREAYLSAPPGTDSNVVIANAYPNDCSLTFITMKGLAPFRGAPAGASRVVIASCPEGHGFHGLFPYGNAPKEHGREMMALRASLALRRPGRWIPKIARRLQAEVRKHGPLESDAERPVWLYRPPGPDQPPLSERPGLKIRSNWHDIVHEVNREQGDENLKVVLYPCSPLQYVAT